MSVDILVVSHEQVDLHGSVKSTGLPVSIEVLGWLPDSVGFIFLGDLGEPCCCDEDRHKGDGYFFHGIRLRDGLDIFGIGDVVLEHSLRAGHDQPRVLHLAASSRDFGVGFHQRDII